MNIEDIPFHRLTGIRPSAHPDYRLEIDTTPQHTNHLGIIHASVLYALADATSGAFLLNRTSNYKGLFVIRGATSKYLSIARGLIRSTVETPEEELRQLETKLQSKRACLFDIKTSVHAEDDQLLARFTFRWFLSLDAAAPSPLDASEMD